jgi:hypothetical protein
MLGDGFGALERLAAFTTTPKRSRLNGNVRYGSLADILTSSRHVRFTPDCGHSSVQVGCPKSAISGRPHGVAKVLRLRANLGVTLGVQNRDESASGEISNAADPVRAR